MPGHEPLPSRSVLGAKARKLLEELSTSEEHPQPEHCEQNSTHFRVYGAAERAKNELMVLFVEANNNPDTDLAGILQHLQLQIAMAVATFDMQALKDARRMLGLLSEYLGAAVEQTDDAP